jgi:hypothetical protein
MGEWEIAVAGRIDRGKLRMALRKLGDELILRMLYDAIELIPLAKLHKLVEPYLDARSLLAAADRPDKLLARVRSFERTSLAGDYYDPFDVNSKNCMNKSSGTIAWIVECNRLLDLCVVQAQTGDAAEARQSFDIIFGLLDEIDACRDDIIFFADEAGAWQVGVDWEKLLPSWFKVLSATAKPDEYAKRVLDLLNRHCDYERPKMLPVARKVASPAQARALAAA